MCSVKPTSKTFKNSGCWLLTHRRRTATEHVARSGAHCLLNREQDQMAIIETVKDRYCHKKRMCPIETLFRQRKYPHQMKHFCCGSAFLLHDNGVLAPLKLQTFKTRFQSGTLLNCNLLSSCVNWHPTKPVKAVTTLLLMLVQVNAFRRSHYQTLIKHSTVHPKRVEYDDSLWRQIRVFIS